MEFTQTDPVVTIEGMEFSAVFFGGAGSLSAVCASSPDGRRWIVSPNQRKMSAETVETYAFSTREAALYMAARTGSERYLPEALAYVRSLPAGRKSDYLDSVDLKLRKEAVADVRNALVVALMTDDPYRAAVQFEARIPYLVADRALVEVMDAIHTDFRSKLDEAEWLSAAAETTEEDLKISCPFVASQVEAWKFPSASNSSG